MTPYNNAAAQAAPVVIPASAKGNTTIKIAIGAFVVMVLIVVGLLTLGMIGALNTGLVGLLLGMILAVLPVPVYLVLATWIDRYEPEPLWMLAGAFLWGATGAVFIAFVLNTLGELIVQAILGEGIAQVYGASISAPVVEESAKGIALLGIFLLNRKEFDGVLDGIVYAAMVGLGFAMTENVSYYGSALAKGGVVGGVFVFILRGVFLPFAHPLFTSMTGIGLGIATESKNLLVKIIAPLLGFATAVLLHSTNNSMDFVFRLMGLGGLVPLLVLIPFMLFLFACLLGIVFLALLREGRMVRKFLQDDLKTGLFTQQDIDCVCSVPRRIGSSFGALTKGGLKGWRARKQFNNMASELAFHRSRVARGLITSNDDALQREASFVQYLRELQSNLNRTNQ